MKKKKREELKKANIYINKKKGRCQNRKIKQHFFIPLYVVIMYKITSNRFMTSNVDYMRLEYL
jgi:hypothetical protein